MQTMEAHGKTTYKLWLPNVILNRKVRCLKLDKTKMFEICFEVHEDDNCVSINKTANVLLIERIDVMCYIILHCIVDP
jgi:hypothetical protein